MLRHVVLNSYPVTARLHPTVGHARDILKRDIERARRAATGSYPHGPLIAREPIQRGEFAQLQSQPSDGTHNIDVTNASKLDVAENIYSGF